MRLFGPRAGHWEIHQPTGWICSSCSKKTGPSRQKWTYTSRTPSDKIQGSQRRWLSSTQRLLAVERKPILPDEPARTRFAPSPTGHLHIGGLRTALFSYLLAKRTGGQFLLRIEDTDQKRLVSGAEERLLQDLRWAGLSWDEGPEVEGPYGPYKQSHRTDIYQRHARELLDRDQAYRCFCTAQTAEEKGKAAFVTSGCYQDCASLSRDESSAKADRAEEPFTVRLRRPETKRKYPDLVYGRITPLKRSAGSVSAAESESGIDAADTILVKSDGTPTYHFANVIDDHLMKITHVIRGTEWMASTPLHYDLYDAFGWQPPTFAHVSLLVDEKQAKLSKRNADMALDVAGMRKENGILPEVLCNFIALQGWSNPKESDVLTMEELIDAFDLKFTRGNTMVRMEKLHYLQKQHVTRRCELARERRSNDPVADIVQIIVDEVKSQYPGMTSPMDGRRDLGQYCTDILLADSKSYQNAKAYVERNSYFFSYDENLVPAVQAFYDKHHSISGDGVQKRARHTLETHEFSSRAVDMTSSQQQYTSSSPVSDVEKASTDIHTVLELAAWRAAISDQGLNGNERDLPSESHSINAEEYCRHVLGNQANEETVSSLLKRKRSWTIALMRYLREQLSYGKPGPSIGMVMALLGYQECCRRLHVRPREGVD